MIDQDLVHSIYGERFGTLHRARPVLDGDEQIRFWILVFLDEQRPGAPVVYATLGAPGPEVVLVTKVQFAALERFVELTAGGGPAELAPLAVVPFTGLDTPFNGFLVAPPEDGSFTAVEGSAAGRRVVRLVPLTPAERALAERKPRKALDRLRAAGALVADPLRRCVIDRDFTAWFRETVVPATVRKLRRAATRREALLAELRDAEAPSDRIAAQVSYVAAARTSLAYFEARGPDVPTDAALLARLEAIPHGKPDKRANFVTDALFDRGLDEVRSCLDATSASALKELLMVVVMTHPDVIVPFHRVITGESAEPPWAKPAVLEQSVYQRLLGIMEHQPLERRKRTFARFAAALVVARSTLEAEAALPRARHLWVCLVRAMYVGEHDTRTPEGKAIVGGIEAVLKEGAALALVDDGRPLFLGLLGLMERLGECLLLGLALSVGPEMGHEVN